MDNLRFTEQKVEFFRQKLMEEKRALLNSELNRETEANQLKTSSLGELSSAPTHPADIGTEAGAQEVAFAIAQRQLRHIRDIEDAIAKLDTDSYGICENCELEILLRNLEVVPERRFCLDCVREFEAEAKQKQRRTDAVPL